MRYIMEQNNLFDLYKEEDFNFAENTTIKYGEIYKLGRHYLMCGNATNLSDVIKLMNNNKADMIFADPPYNVAIGSKNKSIKDVTGQKSNSITEDIIGDSGMTDEEIGKLLWQPAFKNMKAIAKDCCGIYVTMPQGGAHMMMMMMMMSSSWQVKHELIWVKNSPTFSMGRLDYDYQHEPICYGWNKSVKHIKKGKYNKSVWFFDKPLKSNLHPTMKPIPLIINAIENSSEPDDIIVDLFGGSGSTLIACEQTNRICYMMELDPKYVQTIINRYEIFAKRKAIKI